MKAKIRRLEHSGAFDEQEDPAGIARGFAYGIAIVVMLWALAAALVLWLI